MAKISKSKLEKSELNVVGTKAIYNINSFGVKPKIHELKPTEAQNRLASHMAILEQFGFQSLDELGKLNLKSSGEEKKPLYQTRGVVYAKSEQISPQNIPFSVIGSKQTFAFQKNRKNNDKSAKSRALQVLEAQNQRSTADLIVTEPFRFHNGMGSMLKMGLNIDLAYWFAPEINIGDDTDIIIASNVKNLVIITNNLIIGNNVTLTWERPVFTPKSKPATPPKPAGYPAATQLSALTGRPGTNGFKGANGDMGADAPEVEIWMMNLTGPLPTIDLKGQPGQGGGEGGDGSPGGDGQRGCPTEKKFGICSCEQGQGGNGGGGGGGGTAGSGGPGGSGGSLVIYTTAQISSNVLSNGVTIDLTGGEPGPPGKAGNPGTGGAGGAKGQRIHSICPKNNRAAGINGPMGAFGIAGQLGTAGAMKPNALRLNIITPSEFMMALTKPAIVSTNKQSSYAYIGDSITVYGERFANGDKVIIEDFNGDISIPCQTSVVSINVLSFIIPNTIGGLVKFKIRQIDGTDSVNVANILIRPRIKKILSSNRIRPQSEAFISGDGFAKRGYIMINNEDCGAFELIEPGLLKYTVFRPSNVVPNESGENVKLKVVNFEGHGVDNFNHSIEVDTVLDTYRVVVFGDSSIYNGGNVEHNKFFYKIKEYIASNNNIGVYLTVKAHQGAIIGRGLINQYVPFHGELSTDYPTINQQIEEISNLPDAKDFDLVLMTGGANDFEIASLMLKSNAFDIINLEQELKNNIEKYCHIDLKDAILKTRISFPKANILVNGYYHIFSEYSDASKITLLAITLFGAINEIGKDEIASLLTTGNFAGMPPNLSINLNVAKIRRLNNIWVEESTNKIKMAVDEANEALQGDSKISFIDLETQPINAAHAPQSLLWEPVREALLLKPSDPMADERLELVEQVKTRCESGEFSEQDLKNRGYGKKSGFFSKRNSSYHPNVQGAQRYFDKMKPVIDKFELNRKIVIKSFNGSKLSLLNQNLISSNTEATDFSVFEVVKIASNKIALKAQNGLYICAEQGGGSVVNVNRAKAREWESLEIVQAGANYIAFKTFNNFYLSVQTDGIINANSNRHF